MRYVSIGLGLVLILIGVAILFQAPSAPIEPTRQGDAPVFNSVAEYSGKLVANRVLGGMFITAGVLAFCLGGLGCDICEAVANKQRADRLARQLAEAQRQNAQAAEPGAVADGGRETGFSGFTGPQGGHC